MTEFKNLDPSEVKRGDVIEVSVNPDFHDPYERIFVAYIEGSINPFICVDAMTEEEFKAGKPFLTLSWPYARKLRPDLKDGDPVIVWDLPNGDRHRAHFAGWSEDGKILAYENGQTKWTSYDKFMAWDYWRLPTKEELGV